MHSKISNNTTDELSTSASLVSRFLALEQIYSAADLDKHLQSLPRDGTPDVVVLCASAILAIAEAVFEWASSNREHPRRLLLVLCGGVGPCTPFVYDAVKASARYSCISKHVQGRPEAHVLKVIAERFYGLGVGSSTEGLTILMADRSVGCGASPSETQKVLESHGISNPNSITVVQDPAMSRRTVACFESVYSKCGKRPRITSWPALTPEPARYDGKGLWSMDRFLDRILGEMPEDSRRGSMSRVDIPNEVEDAWSTVLGGYGSTCFAATLKS